VHFVAITRDGVWAASGGEIQPPPTAMGFIKAYHISSSTTWTLDNPPEQTSAVALSDDGVYLVAGADQLYLYKRTGAGAAATWSTAQILPFLGRSIKSVSISSNGQQIVAGLSGGEVVLVQNNSGNFGTPTVFQMPTIPTSSPPQRYWVMGVAMANDGSGFAVAGSNATVYYFDVATFPTSKMPAWSQPLAGCASCRSVAVTDDGSLVAVSASDGAIGAPTGTGSVFLFQNNGNSAAPQWATPASTSLAPNQVSIDSTGQFVSVCDGSPPPGPTNGDFYVFDGNLGSLIWTQSTSDMDFAMQLSANGNVAAGGSDDGKTYYFSVP
jgi:WD40 repeat protein